MTSDTVTDKADRLYTQRRFRLTQTLPAGGTVWRVHGDSGSYDVTVDHAGAICTCPAMFECAHQAVAIRAANARDARLVGEHDPEMIDGVDDLEPDPEYDDVAEVDPVTGEILADDVQTQLAVPTGDVDVTAAALTWRTLTAIADTEFVSAGLRGRPAAVLAAVRYGAELGLGPMQSMSEVHILDGSPTLSAALQLRLYRAAGHRLDVTRADAAAVELVGTRGDTDESMAISYSLEDGVQAGLVDVDDDGQPRARSKRGKPMPWETYTADLLWARAVTRLIRRLAPDCLTAPERSINA